MKHRAQNLAAMYSTLISMTNWQETVQIIWCMMHHRSLRIKQTEQVNFWLEFSICNINIYILWYHLSLTVVGHIQHSTAISSQFFFSVSVLILRVFIMLSMCLVACTSSSFLVNAWWSANFLLRLPKPIPFRFW